LLAFSLAWFWPDIRLSWTTLTSGSGSSTSANDSSAGTLDDVTLFWTEKCLVTESQNGQGWKGPLWVI